jgi:hypothetical protein
MLPHEHLCGVTQDVARGPIDVANLPIFPGNDEHDIESRIEQELKFCLSLPESGFEAMQRCRIVPRLCHSSLGYSRGLGSRAIRW